MSTPSRDFKQLLEGKWNEGKMLCVGLDPDLEKIPEIARLTGTQETIVRFNRAIIDATKDHVCAFKPNSAFYEAHGDEGWNALCETVEYIHEVARDVPVILDAKRADIGHTNAGYVNAAFEHVRADALTVHPYLGSEALGPLLDLRDKGIFVLCRTSNPGAGELQDLPIEGEPLYKVVARLVATKWNANGNCGVVVGATYPEELREVRTIIGDMPILVPGIGAQGGDLEKTVAAGKDNRGAGMLISASRSVMYASSGTDFSEMAGKKALELDKAIRAAV